MLSSHLAVQKIREGWGGYFFWGGPLLGGGGGFGEKTRTPPPPSTEEVSARLPPLASKGPFVLPCHTWPPGRWPVSAWPPTLGPRALSSSTRPQRPLRPEPSAPPFRAGVVVQLKHIRVILPPTQAQPSPLREASPPSLSSSDQSCSRAPARERLHLFTR